VNIGAGEDISIGDLAVMIADVVGFEGEIVFDFSKPDGTFRKLMDSGRLYDAGWRPKTGLVEGLALSYAAFSKGMAVKQN
jgi:GDP-L-fucose synthase